MNHHRAWGSSSAAILLVLLFRGVSVAADVCNESVPATRVIDGIPAYAQCASSMNSAIYSNDGVATSTTSGGAGWLRTQFSGGYQCTELAHRYLAFRFALNAVPNGDAGVWCQATLPAGLVKADLPVHGDLIVLAPGSCGADATTGHVAVVDTVSADKSSVMAVQQNSAGRGQYKMTCAACFLHATANTGSTPDGGISDSGTSDSGSLDAPRDGTGDRPAPGTGGMTGTGGTTGTGGSPGAGGAPGTGGESSGPRDASLPEASTGTGGSSSPGDEGGNRGGCACHMARGVEGSTGGWGASLLWAWLWRRRGRRSRSSR